MGLEIPELFASSAQITEGSEVKLTVINGQLIISALPAKRLRLDDLLKNISDSNLHGEIETGNAVGNECC